MKKLLFSLASLAMLAVVGLSAAPVLAFNPFQALCNNSGSSGSALCQAQAEQNANQTNPVADVLHIIAELVAVIAGLTAVIIILIAGISYITSGGDTSKVQGAKNSLVGVIIGLIIIALAGSIISLVLGRL